MSKTILIVEDNKLNMRLFDDLLRANGYSTLQSRDGIEAVTLAEEHQPNLILMDIQLPNISGLEITKKIKEKEELKHIPVIAVTAFAMQGDEDEILESGCDAFIAKPISVRNFLETVADNLF
tara:strand:- start:397 stop:762 length:366 start_codon:yes stop_codon:yes gene_type:complete